MIYLDNAATSFPKPPEVVEAMQHFMLAVGANPGRSGHRLSIKATQCVFETRSLLAQLLGVSDPRNIIFTSNATMAINFVLRGFLKPNDHVVTSSMEHNSVMRPLLRLQQTMGIRVTIVPADTAGRITPGSIANALTDDTKLVVINHASNVTGTIAPVQEIKKAIGALPLLVDAAQTAGSLPINVEAQGIDFLAFTGHKGLYGPQGTGGLYIHPEYELEPLITGGTGASAGTDGLPHMRPEKYEGGTLNAVGITGLGAGVRFVMRTGIESIRNHEMSLYKRLWKGLSVITGVTCFGSDNPDERVATLSFTHNRVSPAQLSLLLDQRYQIMVRAGMHCAPEAHRTIHSFPHGTVRIAPSYFTTETEIDQVITALREIAGEFQ